MLTPVNRLTQYYAEQALQSTLDYIGYCVKRIYPGGVVSWHHGEHVTDGVVRCGLVAARGAHQYVVRFAIPVDAGGAQIKILCAEAADALDNMLLGVATK